jgi:anthranilate phosphoribosyltransferase
MNRLSFYIKAAGAGARRARALSREEAQEALALAVTVAEPVQVGAFLLALRMKGETALELAGFVDALASHTRVAAVPRDTLEVDAHGDGHEGMVSLLPAAACAVAACGVPVWLGVDADSPFARHGLRGGLAAIGLQGELGVERAARDLTRTGVAACDLGYGCPPLRRLVDLRPLLGVRTVAQTLAKLVSSSRAAHRLIGAFHAPYVVPMAETLSLLPGIERGLVVQALGGLPEARPGKLVRVADAGGDTTRTLDLRGLGPAWEGEGKEMDGKERGGEEEKEEEADNARPAAHADAAGRSANRAALDGTPGWAHQAAAAAAVLLHAATGADVGEAAHRALQALLRGDARARAARR